MLCIVRFASQPPGGFAPPHATPQVAAIEGWFIAQDVHDARRKAQGIGAPDLAAALYRMEFPPPGKHDLGNGFVMLVD